MVTRKLVKSSISRGSSLIHPGILKQSAPRFTLEANIKRKAIKATEVELASEPTIQVARTQDQKERAYRLAYQTYIKKGFLSRNDTKRLVSSHDDDPRTLVLLALDQRQEAIATISLFYDSPEGLPSDRAFKVELDALRKQGRKLVEISRLVMGGSAPRSRVLLARLFNLIYIHAYRLEEQTDVLIEVHPRHVPFYRHMFGFISYGPVRPCPYVSNSPAQLMGVQLQNIAGWIAGKNAPRRSLYSHFMGIEMEHYVSSRLELGRDAMVSNMNKAYWR